MCVCVCVCVLCVSVCVCLCCGERERESNFYSVMTKKAFILHNKCIFFNIISFQEKSHILTVNDNLIARICIVNTLTNP